MKKIIVFCCLVLLCACARQPVLQTSPENRAVLEQRWQKFAALGAAEKSKPYRLQLSLRFGTEGDTRRVTALFWGNSQRQLRLDVMAGVGTTVAKILEDGQHFLVYSPSENKAYFYQGATKPLLQNVEGMYLSYGIAATDQDYEASRYVSQTTLDAFAGSTASKWGRVVSVKVCLVMKSQNTMKEADQTYVGCDGSSVAASDGYARRAFTSVFTLRNRSDFAS